MNPRKINFSYYIIAPIFLATLVFGVLVNVNLDKLESVFYDYGVLLAKQEKSSLKEFIFVEINQESSDYLGDYYPFSNKIIHTSLKNIIASEPKSIIYLPELDSFNTEDEGYLRKINNILTKFRKKGGEVFLKQKIDSWGVGEVPDELKEINFYPSILHQDDNIFGEDKITRRALISISGNETLELKISKLLNSRINSSAFRGAYYNNLADANFVLFKYSDNIINKHNLKKIPFYKTIGQNLALKSIRGQHVVVGTSFKSNSDDFKIVPGGQKVSRNELIVEIATSLANGETIKILSRKFSFVCALLVSMLMIVAVFYTKPSNGILIFVGSILFIILISYSILNFTGYYIRIAESLLMGITTFYLCTPFRSILENKRNFVLKEETRILKEVDELKRNFVSLMSHDLKTPVAKIASVVELLKIENTDSELSIELGKIENSTLQLNDFINSILDLTKMESDNFKLNLNTVDLNKLVDKGSAQLGDQIKKNMINLEKRLDVLFPITIDEKLALRVINNLLENAIKYSGPDSTVIISTEDMGQKVRLSVKDNGKGISNKDIKYIFEKFYRVKNDEVPGNGLGLFLVKYFVELMDGEIEVFSHLGQGTEFVVYFKNS